MFGAETRTKNPSAVSMTEVNRWSKHLLLWSSSWNSCQRCLSPPELDTNCTNCTNSKNDPLPLKRIGAEIHQQAEAQLSFVQISEIRVKPFHSRRADMITPNCTNSKKLLSGHFLFPAGFMSSPQFS